MSGRGPAKSPRAQLDRAVLELDLSAAAQVDNTGDMFVIFAQIYRDKRLDESDDACVRTLLAKTKTEHQLNLEQADGMQLIRRLLNPVFALVKTTRGAHQQLVRG